LRRSWRKTQRAPTNSTRKFQLKHRQRDAAGRATLIAILAPNSRAGAQLPGATNLNAAPPVELQCRELRSWLLVSWLCLRAQACAVASGLVERRRAGRFLSAARQLESRALNQAGAH